MRVMNLAIGLKLAANTASRGAWESIQDLATSYTVGYEFYEALIAAGYDNLWDIERMPIPWQNVQRDQVSGVDYLNWSYTEAPRRAEALGHEPESDPPFGMTRAERWTCTRCGDAVLKYNDNIYGSAVDEVCSNPLPRV